MNYKVKAFGVTRDIVGGREIVVEASESTVLELRNVLEHKYPDLKNLRSLMIAVNNSYAENDQIIRWADEIALIPPVSGG